MGRTRGTWAKGQPSPVCGKKGMKAKKTLVKESMGLDSWQKLADFVVKEGAEKWIQEAMKLTGKNYATVYTSLLEFIKPKLGRLDIAARVKSEVTFNITKTYLLPDEKK